MKRVFFTVLFFIGVIVCISAQNSNVVHLTKAEFMSKVLNYEKNTDKWVYEGTKPCIVDFYADWCGPCKKIAPVLEDLALKYKDKVIVYKVNTDKERELAHVFGISSIPTLWFVSLGNTPPQVIRGAIGKEDFEQMISRILSK